jgi:phosphoglycolate phosphatase-like HAD superfamily hydrolase
LSRPEANQRVILWDIDGTLVSLRASRADKHVKAAEVFLDRDLPDQERTAGKTDRQILYELLEANGPDPSPSVLTEALDVLDKLSLTELSLHPVLCNPGVLNALQAARKAGWTNGLLTGNTPIRAQSKLESAGIYGEFDSDFAFFGHEAPNRSELVAAGASAIQSAGCCAAVVIGDTPLDIQSAQSHGLNVVAVATGPFRSTELSEYEPSLLINDLESGLSALIAYLKLTAQYPALPLRKRRTT